MTWIKLWKYIIKTVVVNSFSAYLNMEYVNKLIALFFNYFLLSHSYSLIFDVHFKVVLITFDGAEVTPSNNKMLNKFVL